MVDYGLTWSDFLREDEIYILLIANSIITLSSAAAMGCLRSLRLPVFVNEDHFGKNRFISRNEARSQSFNVVIRHLIFKSQ